MSISPVLNQTVQQEPWSFPSWCRVETSNLFSPFSEENQCLEIIRRIVIVASVIIPLIGLIVLCCQTKEVEELTPLPLLPLAELREEIRVQMPLFYKLMYSTISDNPLDYPREYLVNVAKELGFKTTVTKLHEIDFRKIYLALKTKFKNLNEYVSLNIKTESANRLYGYFVTKSVGDSLIKNQRCLVVIHKNKNGDPLYSFRPGSRDLFQWPINSKTIKEVKDLVRTKEEFNLLPYNIEIYVSSKIPEPPTSEKEDLNHQFSNFYHSGAITSWVALLTLILPVPDLLDE